MRGADGYARLRKGRYSEVENVYHITFSTRDRKPVFSDFYRARQLLLTMKECSEKGLVESLAYVIMPDHVHWLFVLKQGSVSAAVQRVKSFYTKIAGENVWNKGFYDHGIRTDESFKSVARYIIANPVRAGLVEKVADYPHWDAVWV